MCRGVCKPPQGAALISMREHRALIGQKPYVHPVTYAIAPRGLVKNVRTPRDVRYSRALIGRKAYVHPVTYAITAL